MHTDVLFPDTGKLVKTVFANSTSGVLTCFCGIDDSVLQVYVQLLSYPGGCFDFRRDKIAGRGFNLWVI